MKKQILTLAAFLFLSLSTVMAQAEARPQRTVEERTSVTMDKMAPLELSTETKSKVLLIITDFYTAQQKAMSEMRAAANPDKEAMKAKRQELIDARDAKLKGVLTATQFKKWSEEIEPSQKPKRKSN